MSKSKKDNKPAKTEEEKEMSFLDHLEELRWHIIRAVIAIALFAIVVFVMRVWVFDNIILGPMGADFPTYRFFCGISEAMCFTPPDLLVKSVTLDEKFLIALKVSMWLGFVGAFPFVFYQFWSFIKPGLYEKEQKVARGMVFICSLLFSAGVVFGYYAISPFAIKFLGSFDIGVYVEPEVSLKSIVGYMVMFTIPAGITFELPIVVYFLSKIGLVTPEFLRKYRKHAFVLILIFAAIITPPDVVTQFLIGVPVFILYEISIYISGRVEKKEKSLAKT